MPRCALKKQLAVTLNQCAFSRTLHVDNDADYMYCIILQCK